MKTNRSELKKMTARDYEDMLQVRGTIGWLQSDLRIQLVCYTRF